PDMDGYEVCQQLKADERTRDIPVIFLSALDDVLDKIKAFSVGGVDYITKPFEDQEVLARVQTHLELKHAREKLQQQNRELIEAARLREDVERITRHDLKTPLNSIIGFPQVMMRDGNLTAKQSEYLKMIKNAGLTMLNMINLSLDMFKMERGTYKLRPVPVNLLPTIRRIINDTDSLAITRRLSAVILIDGKPADNEENFS
ncbi:MAG: response regulator, partial [Desulfobacteraceae bacterium]|nr:response regulator [Desulfobacteraceae bacterium]